MKAFFPYYGAKLRASGMYPAPRHDMIVEPFAGSAGYSVRHGAGKRVILVDADENIARTWDFLTRATERDISSIPDVERGQPVRDIRACEEARLLVGWWVNRGSATPKNFVSSWSADGSGWCEETRQTIASQLRMIRRWKIIHGGYEHAPDVEATHFIDPPYSCHAGRLYRHNHIDYRRLSKWCRSRNGRVIVCEGRGADWLPFATIGFPQTSRGFSVEKMWARL